MIATHEKPSLERELKLTRLIDAPRERVFAAWTEPALLARWWGPKDFTNPVCEVDARAGGALHIVMRGPGGAEHPMPGVFREIEPLTKIVFHAEAIGPEGQAALETVTTVTFADEDGKTRLTLQTRATGLIPAAAAMLQGMEAGWNQSIDRLEDMMGGVDRLMTQTRFIDAPRERVFKMWTDPKKIVQWWGPIGFTTTIQEMDVRPGGTWRLVMHGPDGKDYQNEVVYREVSPPERLVFSHVSYPGHETAVTFAAMGDKTVLTMRMHFKSASIREMAIREFGADEGQAQTLTRLEELLARGD